MTIGICVANYVASDHDVNMEFLHAKGPAEKFFWPQRDNVCWILIEDAYCKIDAPSTGSTGQFCFDKKKQCKKLKAISIKTSSSIVHYYLGSYFCFSIFIFFYL